MTASRDREWRVLLALVVFVTILGKSGDALAPALVHDRPLTLLALNANDLHLGLTARRTSPLAYALVGVARRLAEDPVFYRLGATFGPSALDRLERRFPGRGLKHAVSRTEAWFRRFALVAVAVEPGAAVCFLAGATRMPLGRFAAANVAGTVARVAAIRAAAGSRAASEVVEAVLAFVERRQTALTAATACVVAFACVPTAGAWIRSRRDAIRDEKEARRRHH
jgi:membrane protein DedA with SNARE-associated domain